MILTPDCLSDKYFMDLARRLTGYINNLCKKHAKELMGNDLDWEDIRQIITIQLWDLLKSNRDKVIRYNDNQWKKCLHRWADKVIYKNHNCRMNMYRYMQSRGPECEKPYEKE